MKSISSENLIIKLVLFAGVLLSLTQFIYNRSLWIDEAALALNIINRSHFELLKPMDYLQVAPVLFLQIEKGFSELIPNTEFGLRLFPLLCFWLSMFFFYKTLNLIHNNPYTIIFSLSLFIFNTTMIYYSSEVKQYMSDVLVLTAVFYFILKKQSKEKYRYFLLGVVGTISIFLSNVGPIIVFTAGLYLLSDIYHKKMNNMPRLIIIYAMWASSFLLYYFLFIHSHPLRNSMLNFWNSHQAFMPINPATPDFYQFIFLKTTMIVFNFFTFGTFGGVCLFFIILTGIIYLIRKRETGMIVLTITPLIIHLLLSGLRLYPFDKRLVLYISPCIILIGSYGFKFVIDRLFTDLKIERLRLLAVLIPLFMLSCFFANGFPARHKEIKESISYILQHINRNDKIYVHCGSFPAFKYYDQIGFMNISAPVIIDHLNGYHNEERINELKKLKGKTWLLFSHVFDNQEINVVRRLDSLGYQKIRKFETFGSSAYLYDFGQ
jgi:hypothetical protein